MSWKIYNITFRFFCFFSSWYSNCWWTFPICIQFNYNFNRTKNTIKISHILINFQWNILTIFALSNFYHVRLWLVILTHYYFHKNGVTGFLSSGCCKFLNFWIFIKNIKKKIVEKTSKLSKLNKMFSKVDDIEKKSKKFSNITLFRSKFLDFGCFSSFFG